MTSPFDLLLGLNIAYLLTGLITATVATIKEHRGGENVSIAEFLVMIPGWPIMWLIYFNQWRGK